MCFVEVRLNMRMLIVSGVVLIFLSSVSGSAGGINEEMSLEGTGLISMNYNDFVLSSESFEIELELDSETSDNGTQVTWVTQICINTGVCYPPENNHDWVTNDESKFLEVDKKIKIKFNKIKKELEELVAKDLNTLKFI